MGDQATKEVKSKVKESPLQVDEPMRGLRIARSARRYFLRLKEGISDEDVRASVVYIKGLFETIHINPLVEEIIVGVIEKKEDRHKENRAEIVPKKKTSKTDNQPHVGGLANVEADFTFPALDESLLFDELAVSSKTKEQADLSLSRETTTSGDVTAKKNRAGKKELFEVIKISGKELADLKKISSQRHLALNGKELEEIKKYFASDKTQSFRKKRGMPAELIGEPSDAEMEMLAQTWSEHCKHKIFASKITYSEYEKASGENEENKLHKETIDSLYSTYIKKTTQHLQKNRKDLLSVFSDNAGIVAFDEKYAYACKVETHNAPSALDPFGGAITGIVGVNRDIIGSGIGFEPLCNINVLCFGRFKDVHPASKHPEKIVTTKKFLDPKTNTKGTITNIDTVKPDRHYFSPKQLLEGVHKGIRKGGNESGIPTVAGAFVFHKSYTARPLVYCGTIGIAKREINGIPIETKSIEVGDLICIVGGRVGRDGIHGATASSDRLDKTSPSSMVQIGDPLTQKRALDFLMEARDRGLYRAITDNGAGGIASSVGEMACLSGGAILELDKALLKVRDLLPWEILVSESQERMTLAVPPENKEKLKMLAKSYGSEICFMGEFTDSGYFEAVYQDTNLVCLDLDFLHEGVPQLELFADYRPGEILDGKNEPLGEGGGVLDKYKDTKNKGLDWGKILHELLRRENIASKETLVRQYDHEVKASTIVKPFDGENQDAPNDGAVIRPYAESNSGLVMGLGIASKYANRDSYAMTMSAVDEAFRTIVAAGGLVESVVGLDNFCWPDPVYDMSNNPTGKRKLGALVRSCKALKDICMAYQIPIVSGKDSMKNDFLWLGERFSVVPTLLFTAVGKIRDCHNAVTATFKQEGSSIYLIGETHYELGGSEFAHFSKLKFENVPTLEKLRLPRLYQMYKSLEKAMGKGLISSAHDLSDGGLAVSLAESCFGTNLGASIDIKKVNLFGKTSKKNDEEVEKVLEESFGQSNKKNINGNEISKDRSSIGPYDLATMLFSESNGRILLEIPKDKEKDFLKIVEGLAEVQCLGEVTAEARLIIKDGSASSERSFVIDEDVEKLKESWKGTFSNHFA